jgi:hypothetical protein
MAETLGGAWLANDGSVEGQKFWFEHGEVLTDIQKRIQSAFKEHDGQSILLWDAALRGIIAGIADGLSSCEIRVEEDS